MHTPLIASDGPISSGVIVFRGPRAACSEAALVLEAKGLDHELAATDGGWAVSVPVAASEAARDELARYALERTVVRRAPPNLATFRGAGLGAGIYAFVLLIAAYLAGIHAFGADWLARGSLDARTGGGRDWWRSVTALTLHLDQAHLLGNVLFGVGIGALAGRAFGPGVAWASILAAGAAANYLDMLIAPSSHRAVGASTAVFAALGLLVGYAWRRALTWRAHFKHTFGPLFAGVGLLALLGAGDEHVDVLGHVLGFVAGVTLGWMYSRTGIPAGGGRRVQAVAGAAALGLIVLAWWLALRR
jgi:membrane associated rhomboid family serine protease